MTIILALLRKHAVSLAGIALAVLGAWLSAKSIERDGALKVQIHQQDSLAKLHTAEAKRDSIRHAAEMVKWKADSVKMFADLERARQQARWAAYVADSMRATLATVERDSAAMSDSVVRALVRVSHSCLSSLDSLKASIGRVDTSAIRLVIQTDTVYRVDSAQVRTERKRGDDYKTEVDLLKAEHSGFLYRVKQIGEIVAVGAVGFTISALVRK